MHDYRQKSLKVHRKLNGKIEIIPKAKVETKDDLSVYYTPGVGAVSSYVAQHKSEIKDYTLKGNTIAVISDGSAVLGLGNIGPEGALPVMEGKAMLFKAFGGVNAFPICLATQDTEEIIQTIKNIAPVFGGINLEDISAPRCFEIEERLRCLLDIPVFHDDQHGTAIVVLAGLMNAFKAVGKDIKKSKIAVIGAGAAGTAITKLLLKFGVKNIVVCDSKGVVSRKRTDLGKDKMALAQQTNPEQLTGGPQAAMKGADAVVGVSKPGAFKAEHLKLMNKDSVVFSMANPIPEIMPDEAKKAGAAVVATGRSDYPNQINNSLVFPGVFKGALENEVRQVTPEMEVQAAKNLAGLVRNPKVDFIIPSIFDKRVVNAVSGAIK